MSTNAFMTNRATKSISKEIAKVSENLNTWSVLLKQLIKLRRLLLNNHNVDSDLYMVANAFSKLFYKNQAKVNDYHLDSDSEAEAESEADAEAEVNSEVDQDTGSDSNEKRRKQNQKKSVEMESTEEEDVDEILRKIIASESTSVARTRKVTPMQQAALNTLTIGEQEAKELDDLMEKKRRQLERDMNKPQPKAPVKFTLDIDKTLDAETGRPIDCCVYPTVSDEDELGEILEEESIKSDVHPITTNLEKELTAAMIGINNDKSIHPILAMQAEDNIFSGLPELDPSVENVQNESKESNKSKEPQSEHVSYQESQASQEFDPKYGPLLKLSAYARKRLQYKWFNQAKKNVDVQTSEHPVSPSTRDRLIREETTRLQDYYCETH